MTNVVDRPWSLGRLLNNRIRKLISGVGLWRRYRMGLQWLYFTWNGSAQLHIELKIWSWTTRWPCLLFWGGRDVRALEQRLPWWQHPGLPAYCSPWSTLPEHIHLMKALHLMGHPEHFKRKFSFLSSNLLGRFSDVTKNYNWRTSLVKRQENVSGWG